MLRELSFLKNLSHPNISQLKNAYLHKDQLYCFFDFIEYTLHEVINPMRSRNCGEALSEKHAKMFTLQILDGIRYCHSRGVLHRNLKPKHLLVKMRDPNDLSTACIKICDFALVRSTNIPIRTYTNEVVTLWYRPPEVLMGDKYFLPIDVWSIGCIFGEMLLGKPLFPGISEIDQLFQIFSTLGTPSVANGKASKNCQIIHLHFLIGSRKIYRKYFQNYRQMAGFTIKNAGYGS